MRSVPAITFDVRPSRRIRQATLAIGVLALLALVSCGLPLAMKAAGATAVTAYLVVALRSLGRMPLSAVGWRSDGGWTLRLPDGEDVDGHLLSAHMSGPLTMLRLGWSGGRAALALLPDNLDADTRRRLRMRLSACTDTD